MPTRPAKKATRGPNQRTPTAAELDFISRSRLQGRGWREIAETIKAEQSTVIQWFRLRIEPLWKAAVGKQAHQEVALLDELQRICFGKFFEETTSTPNLAALRALKLTPAQMATVAKMMPKGAASAAQGWISLILNIVDKRCQIRGDYAPKQQNMTLDTGYRVAGSTAGEESERMLQRLLAAAQDRVKFEATIKAAEGSEN